MRGIHDRFAAFGALADDGRQPFRAHGRLGAASLLRCPHGTRRKFGRVAVIVDRATQHRAAVAGDCLEGCANRPRRSTRSAVACPVILAAVAFFPCMRL